MATQPYRNVAYGLSEALLNVAQAPIIAQRDPATTDRAQLGTEWINQKTDDVFILVKVEDNVSTWISIGAGTSATTFDADSGSAMPAGGIINLLSGSGDLTTSASGNTVTFTSTAADIFDSDSGTATPSSNTIIIAGGSGITTSAAGSTVTITASGGGGITTIDGDTGSATGSTLNLVTGFTSGPYANGTIQFNASGTTVTLNTTDGLQNTGVGPSVFSQVPGSSAFQNAGFGQAAGLNVGNGGGAATGNCLFGFAAGSSITSGNYNVALGLATMNGVVSGQYNIGIGAFASNALTGAESSNIYFNSQGVLGESNTLRIGTATGSLNQDLAAAYICGIDGVNVGSVATVVTMAADQLGTATITAGSGISVTPTANTITIAATGGGGGITTIDGNSGSVTGSTVTLTTGAANANGTALFTGSSATMTLTFTDTNDNTGIGTNSLSSGTLSGSLNSCFGFSSGAALTSTADDNTFIGANCGSAATDCSSNTYVGNGAGYFTTTGSFNSFLGHEAGYSYTSSESSNISIGCFTIGTIGESHTLRIGSATGTSDGNLNSSFIAGIQTIVVTGTPVLVSSSDQLGVASSSKRFKNDIQDMSSASDVIYKLRPVTFTWDRNSAPGLKDAPEVRQCGLIAEEVAPLLPQIVGFDKSGSPLNINYGDLTSLLVNEIQKLNTRILALEALCQKG